MFLSLLSIAAFIILAGYCGYSARQRVLLLVFLASIILPLKYFLPNTHPIQLVLGGSPGSWALACLLALLLYSYIYLLVFLRAKAQASPPSVPNEESFKAAELKRYSRQIMLHAIGGSGQKKLKQARVFVVGAGGLGAASLPYLAAAGVGKIGLIDHDHVSLSNLHRQVIFTTSQIGEPKVFAAQKRLSDINPLVDILPFHRRLEHDNAQSLFSDFDLVLDGSDNFATRSLVNAACVMTKTPLISAAISQWEGQISLFNPADTGPCYQCVFPNSPKDDMGCAGLGVMGALPGVMGAMMASEAIKWITQAGDQLQGRLLIYDALYGESRSISLVARSDCPICHGIGLS